MSVIARIQPVTRYGVLRAIQQSPTTSYNFGKGTLYPLVSRLIQRKYVSSHAGNGPHGSEELTVTKPGRVAVRQWINRAAAEDLFGYNPLLDRILALADMSHEERISWIAHAKEMLLSKKEELNQNRPDSDVPYGEIVHGSAVAMIDSKLEWLDRLLIKIVRDEREF